MIDIFELSRLPDQTVVCKTDNADFKLIKHTYVDHQRVLTYIEILFTFITEHDS